MMVKVIIGNLIKSASDVVYTVFDDAASLITKKLIVNKFFLSENEIFTSREKKHCILLFIINIYVTVHMSCSLTEYWLVRECQ